MPCPPPFLIFFFLSSVAPPTPFYFPSPLPPSLPPFLLPLPFILCLFFFLSSSFCFTLYTPPLPPPSSFHPLPLPPHLVSFPFLLVPPAELNIISMVITFTGTQKGPTHTSFSSNARGLAMPPHVALLGSSSAHWIRFLTRSHPLFGYCTRPLLQSFITVGI